MEAMRSLPERDDTPGWEPHTFSVVGTGRMASALVPSLVAAGLELQCIYSRTKSKASSLVRHLTYGDSASIAASQPVRSDILFLLVSDDAIAEVADIFARKRERWDDQVVLHTSGVHTSASLGPFRALGAQTGSMHPLQTVSGRSTDHLFRDIPIMVEGEASGIACRISRLLGAVPHVVETEDKVRIHTAAVIVSNYLTVLIELANSLLADAGIPHAILRQLAREALENSLTMGPAEALTGPIVRGDVTSLRKQLKFLTADRPDLLGVFEALSEQAVRLALSSGRISTDGARAIADVLNRAHSGDRSADSGVQPVENP